MLDLGRDHPLGTSAILVLTRAQTPVGCASEGQTSHQIQIYIG